MRDQTKKETEREKKNFFVLRFSRNRFLNKKNEVFPLFLRNGWADRAEIFFTDTPNEFRCGFFFFFENISPLQYGDFRKTSTVWKTAVFQRYLQHFAFSDVLNRQFSKQKKKPHLDWILVSTKKVSARNN